MPACALTCITGENILAMANAELLQKNHESKHKFDAEIQFTIRELWANRGRTAIRIFKKFAEAFGKEKVIELLKELTYERAKRNGERFRQEKGTNDFETFKTRFVGPDSYYQEALIVTEMVENSKNVLAFNVTECVIPEVWLKSNAGEYGYAHLCWGDHCWQDGYNKKIKLIRDKTIMQGYDYCNFRFVLEDY
jgi:hypothetical protein